MLYEGWLATSVTEDKIIEFEKLYLLIKNESLLELKLNVVLGFETIFGEYWDISRSMNS